MTTTATTSSQDLDPDVIGAFTNMVVGDLGAAMHAPLVWLGDRLGLYEALADGTPTTADALAGRAGTDARMTHEWLCANAAAGYVCTDDGTFWLPPEHAAVLTDSQVTLQGGFDCVVGVHRSIDKALDAMRTGKGLGWSDHHDDFFCGVERFFGPTYRTTLRKEWLPAMGKVLDKLDYGGRIADVGCGHGIATIELARRFPMVGVDGFDFHPGSVDRARRAAQDAGVGGRCEFEVADATTIPDRDYDLVCFFDCLHDMADPVGAARRAFDVINDDGAVMVVEPIAGDAIADNLHPVGRLLYSTSTLACSPCSLAGDGPALGAQAGPDRMTSVLTEAGFGSVGVACTTDFNYVLDARKS